MSTKLKVVLLMGSVRDNRFCDRVTQFLRKKLEETNHEVSILDPLELDLPLLKQPLHWYRDASKAPQVLHDTDKVIQNADAFIAVTSEYNQSIPPALVNMLDHFSPTSYAYRPSALVSYSLGPLGGCRAAMALTSLLRELNTAVIPAQLVLPKVSKIFTETGEIISDEQNKENLEYNGKVERVIQQLDWYATAFKNQKSAAGLGPM